jgi:hypothetical protein
MKDPLFPQDQVDYNKCSYRHGIERCEHPVGFVAAGMRGGWCLLHRNSPGMGREICVESKLFTRERYIETARKITYGTQDNPHVAALRKTIQAHLQRKHRGGPEEERQEIALPKGNLGLQTMGVIPQEVSGVGEEVLAGSYQAEY